MYEGFFKLNGRPFAPAPVVARYFPAASIEGARQTLRRVIERGEGAATLIGPGGTGKTLLCRMLVDEFADRFSTALLASGRLSTRQALLQVILYELGLPYRGLDEGELRLALLDHLEPHPHGNAGLLLIVDEAHTLPFRLLEEVRLLTNFVRDGQSRVRVVLAGSPQLEERFASPRMASFSQRLAARCYLEALNAAETAEYVQAQIIAVGGDESPLFDAEALQAIYQATDGIPRLINQVCDHALILASLGGVARLTAEGVEEAWADLQQLPGPWSSAGNKPAAGTHVVEFGSLDDAREPAPEAIPFRPSVARRTEPISRHTNELPSVSIGVDDDYRPAGMIGTEVDLDFPEFGDPFGEQFAEEEVVLDRYPSDIEIFADVQRVSSWEGSELGSLLTTFEVSKPTFSSFPRFAGRPTATVVDTPLATHAGPSVYEEATRIGSPLVLSDEPAATVRRAPLAEVAGESTSDREIIVVDDDVLLTRPVAASPPKKSEYRQLFAKLRRG